MVLTTASGPDHSQHGPRAVLYLRTMRAMRAGDNTVGLHFKRPLIQQRHEQVKRAKAGSEDTTQGPTGQTSDDGGLGTAGGPWRWGEGDLRHISKASMTGLNRGLDTGLKERGGMSQE